MSYQLQFRALVEEFRRAGLPAESATRIAQILANPSQSMRSGPVEVDTTPGGLRQVTPSRRKHQLTNLDFLEGDPYHRRRKLRPTEERPRPEPASAVQSPVSPQQTDAPFGVSAGNYTETRSGPGGVEVGLRVTGTGPFLTQDQASGALTGKSIRAEADTGENGILRFFVEEQADEYVFRIQLDRDAMRDLVYELLKQPPRTDPEIPAPPTPEQFLVDATLDSRGLCFRRGNGQVFCIPAVSCDQ